MDQNEILLKILTVVVDTQKDVKELTARVAALEERVTALEKKMDSIEKRMDSIEKRMDSLEERMDSLEQQMRELRKDTEKFKKEMIDWGVKDLYPVICIEVENTNKRIDKLIVDNDLCVKV